MLKPLNDTVIVEVAEASVKAIPGGVIERPDQAIDKPQNGKIISVGPGKLDKEGNRQPMPFKVDDEVLFAKYSGTEIKFEGKDYLLLSERDILAIF